jgi:hypothetical protein
MSGAAVSAMRYILCGTNPQPIAIGDSSPVRSPFGRIVKMFIECRRSRLYTSATKMNDFTILAADVGHSPVPGQDALTFSRTCAARHPNRLRHVEGREGRRTRCCGERNAKAAPSVIRRGFVPPAFQRLTAAGGMSLFWA